MALFRSSFPGFFPFEIMIKILLLLPSQSLIRMTLVCKEWCSLITEAEFMLEHFESSRDHLLSGPKLFRGPGSLKFLDYKNPCEILLYKEIPILFDRIYCQIVNSCNGLLCFTDGIDFGTTIYLLNPFVRKCREVKTSTFGNVDDKDRDFEFMFVGFGFHTPTNDHKIVRIAYTNDYTYISGEVYSLSTNSWQGIEVGYFPWTVNDNLSRTAIHDRVHCMVYKYAESMILSFDFGSQLFEEIGLPYEYRAMKEHIHEETLFLVKGSSLAFGVVYDEESSRFCTVWVMQEYGVAESWTRNFRVQIFREILYRTINSVKTNGIVYEDSSGEMVVWNFDVDHISSDNVFEQVCESHDLVVVRDNLFMLNDPPGNRDIFNGEEH